MTPRPKTPRPGSLTPRPYNLRLTAYRLSRTPRSLALNTETYTESNNENENNENEREEEIVINLKNANESESQKIASQIPSPNPFASLFAETKEPEPEEGQSQAPSPNPFANLYIEANSRDEKYEFNAPQYHDFLTETNDSGIDNWFDERTLSPPSVKKDGVDDPFDFDAEHSFQEHNFQDQDAATPKADAEYSFQEQDTATPKADVEYSCQEQDTATPKASKLMGGMVAASMDDALGSSGVRGSLGLRAGSGSLGPPLRVYSPARVDIKNPFLEKQTVKSIQKDTKPVTSSRLAKGGDKPAVRGVVPKVEKPVQKGPKAPTQPKEFSFMSRMRVKNELGPRAPGGIQKKKPLGRSGGMTIPKPFQFHSTLRSMGNDVTESKQNRSPFVPLAVKVKKFETTVPDRFKTKAKPYKVASYSMPASPWAGHVRLTKARSPFLLTKLRKKTHRIPSREETELAELAKVQPFKAKRVNPKILHTDRPLGVPEKPQPRLTVAESPAITKPRPPPQRGPSPPKIVKAHPIPKAIFQPFEPQIEHRVLAPTEFVLPGDEISRRKKMEFEERVRREKEEEGRAKRFHAQPLPYDEPDPLPEVEPRPLTAPQPFNLETDLRGSFARLTLEEKLEREAQEQERLKNFRANPIPASIEEPFIPHPSSKPLTDVENVVLRTDMRAEERRLFEERLKKKEEEEERLRREEKRRQEEREEYERRLLRQQTVHRAQPILHTKMKPVVVQKSQKKLTEPASPFIGDKRKKAREMQVQFDATQRGGGGEIFSLIGGGGRELQERLFREARRREEEDD